ncbi:MAG: MqnA/MqnD/SBP family protein [Rikenellaceae bacterium]
MAQIRIATVEYLNSLPFQYGIEESGLVDAQLRLATPAECSTLLHSEEVDVALIPIAAIDALNSNLPEDAQLQIVTSHCIGTNGAVRTVTLMSDDELKDIKRIWLDTDSQTSVRLLAYLCKNHFGISPEWHRLTDKKRLAHPKDGDAFLLIGDKVFAHEAEFEFVVDLAEEWVARENQPFVFAAWCVRGDNPVVNEEVLSNLDEALTWGVEHTFEALQALRPDVEIEEGYRYLTENIDTLLDNAKMAAMKHFLGSKCTISITSNDGEDQQ